MAAESPGDVESLLRSALRPIEPPENLSGRLEETLSAVTEAAAEELSAWAEELSESELRSLRQPRNWVRPAAAIAAGSVAAGGLTLAAADTEVVRLDPHPSLRPVVLIPNGVRLPTAQARAALADQVPRADAVFNVAAAGKLLLGLADGNLDLGNSTSKEATKSSDNPSGSDSGSSSTPKAKSGESSGSSGSGGTTLTVAAAAAIAIVTAKEVATPDDGLSITSSGVLTEKTTEDVDSKVIANASATKAKTANIGAAAAISLVKVTNDASAGLGTCNSESISDPAAPREASIAR